VRLQTFVRAFRFGQNGTKNGRSAWTVCKFLSTSGTPPWSNPLSGGLSPAFHRGGLDSFPGKLCRIYGRRSGRGEDFLRVVWCSPVVTLPPVQCLMC
jgi:hypothetical protein